MAGELIQNPPIPYVGQVEGGVVPGKMVKVQGKAPSDAVRFAINYQLGPTLNPRDDIAIHVSPRFPEGFITRNHIVSMTWGMEENEGPMWIQPGQEFEILLLCDHDCFKIAINGRHFTEFAHRLPYQKITHLVIDGDVEVDSISYEIVPVDPPRSPRSAAIPDVPPPNVGPPPPGGLYPTLGPQGYGPPGYGPQGYGPPPPADAYNPPRAYGQEKPEENEVFGGCLDKMGLTIGGLVAAGGVAAAAYALNKKSGEEEKEHEKTDSSKSKTESEGGLGYLGSLKTALASSLVSNALQSHATQGYPSQEPSGGGGVLGSILGALGGSGGAPQPAPPPPANNDPLKGAIGSILGGVFGGGGSQQQQPAYQPSGGYQPAGYPGYGQQQSSGGSDLLSGLGSAIGSSLLSSALEAVSKHDKDKSHSSGPAPPPAHNTVPFQPAQSAPRSDSPPSTGGHKLTADEISKGLGLDG